MRLFSKFTERNMLILKEFILCMVTTFFAVSVHAGHKRVIIRVPQRTRHIYHHHVKKVPVYVLLPDKKPKVIEEFEEVTKSTSSPCLESHSAPSWREEKPSSYRYARSEGEREYKKNQQSWTEDRENKGAYLPADSYRTIEDDFPPPPPINPEDLPFRRINTEDSPSLYMEPPQEQKSHQPQLTYLQSAPVERMPVVSFTYAPDSMNDSYQYRISSRMDNMTMER